MNIEEKFAKNYNILLLINDFSKYIEYRKSIRNGDKHYMLSSRRETLDSGIEKEVNYYIPTSLDDIACRENDAEIRKLYNVTSNDLSADPIIIDGNGNISDSSAWSDYFKKIGDIKASIGLANNGLCVLLAKGNICQLYLPNYVNNNFISNLIKTVESKNDCIFYLVFNNFVTDELTKGEVVSGLKEKITYKCGQQLSKKQYFELLNSYLNDNRLHISKYYSKLADDIINGNVAGITDFEFGNPFTTEQDIMKLIHDRDKASFANKTTNLVQEYFKNSDFYSKNTSGKKIKITSLNEELLSEMDGFDIIKEEKAGTIDISWYSHDNNSKTHICTQKVKVMNDHIQNGLHINIMEFVNKLKNEYQGNIIFVTPNNDEIDFDTVMDAAFRCSNEISMFPFSEDYIKLGTINYEKLSDIYDGSKLEHNGLQLTKGYYAKRDALEQFFSKLKIKVVTEKEEEPKTYKF